MHQYQYLWNPDTGHRDQTLRHHLCPVLVVQNCIHLNQLLLQMLCQHIDHLHLKRHPHHHLIVRLNSQKHQQLNREEYFHSHRDRCKHHRHRCHLCSPMDIHRRQFLPTLHTGMDKHQHCCQMHYRQSHPHHNLGIESGREGSHHLYSPSHRDHCPGNLEVGLLMFQRRLDSHRG